MRVQSAVIWADLSDGGVNEMALAQALHVYIEYHK